MGVSDAETSGQSLIVRRNDMTLPLKSFYPEKGLPSDWSVVKFAFEPDLPTEDETACEESDDKQEPQKTLRELLEENDLQLRHKVCTKCRQDLPLDSFSKDANTPSGRRARCKKCVAEAEDRKEANRRSRESRARHPERISELNKKNTKTYDEKHPKRRAELRRAWKIKNWAKQKIYRIKDRALKSGIPFNMNPLDLLDKNTGALPESCPIFPNIRLDYNAGPDRRCWPSVDKIVPELGYVSGNVWVISMAANLWKSNGSNENERKRIVALMQGRTKRKEPVSDQLSLFDEV
jgi:hypothetical protein